MATGRLIVGIGEALFDIYPDGERLGGAPLNVAVHAQQLGDSGIVVSRIGQDSLGRRVIDELAQRSMTAEHVQSDPDRPTGTVLVDLDDKGEPTYDIVKNVAWDCLQFDPDLESLARRIDAVCFGTLAQRDAQTRNTIYRFLEAAPQAVRLLDVNLRQAYYDRHILTRSLELANAVKLNTTELRTLDEMFGLAATFDDAATKLLTRHKLKWVALTRGADGVVVYTPTGRFEGDAAPASQVADAVGAGDATSAALLHGVVRRWPWPRTITLANMIGAHVVTQPGACPPLSDEVRKLA